MTSRLARDSKASNGARNILDALPDLMFRLDASGVFLDYKGAEEDLYLPPDSFLGKNVSDVLPADLAAKTLETMRKALESGKPQQYEYALEIKNKQRFYEARAMKYDSGEVLVIARDTTDRQAVEQALQESEEKYRLLFMSDINAIVVIDGESLQIIDANGAACQLYGYPLEELVGMSAPELSAEPEASRESINKTLSDGSDRVFLRHHRTKDGTVFPVEASAGTFELRGRKVICAIFRDMTGWKKAEEAIRASETRLKEAQAIGEVGDWEIDVATGQVTWSDQVYRLFERARAEGPPDIEQNLSYYFPEDAARLKEQLRRATEEGEEFAGDYHLKLPSGRSVYQRGIMKVLKDDDGEVIRLRGTVQDITSHKDLEFELRKSNTKLAAALERLKETQQQIIQHERLAALGQMASGIAHDFNNALMPILGYTDLLINNSDALEDREEALSMLEEVRRAACDASQAVHRMREFYRRPEEHELAEVKLDRTVKTAIDHTRPRWQEEMAARGVFIDVQTDFAMLPPVRGNESELREALTNVILNAVDAMPEGGVIAIRTGRQGSTGAVIEVRDSGTGMSEDVQRRCLEPFFSTKGGRGTGLGLSMVYGIAQRHDGTLDVRSTPGEGTVITISLPLADSAVPESPPADNADTITLEPLHILFVDDELATRRLVQIYLTEYGHTVELAEYGEEALRIFRNDNFDLVILDRAMPRMSGDQVAVAIRAIDPSIPVIMLTGFGSLMKDRQDCPKDVDLVVGKPVTQHSLYRAIADVLHGRRPSGTE